MTANQNWDPNRYAQNARFVAELGRPMFDLLEPTSSDRVLDLGCGDGALTEELATLVGTLVGIDASTEQVAAARKRGIDARVTEAERLTFDEEFDAVISNAVLHWINQPNAVIAGVFRALKKGGRFVGEFGGRNNVATIRHALHAELGARGIDPLQHDPWYFPTDVEYRERLEDGGFEVRSIELFPRPVVHPGDITGWLATFAESFLIALPEDEHEAFFARIRERVKPQLLNEDGRWTVDYVRLRFVAIKPT